MPEELAYGIDDYSRRLDALTASPEFGQLPQVERGHIIAKFRDEYSKGLTDENDLKVAADLAKVKSDFTKGDRYRIDPDSFKSAGLTYPELNVRTKEEALSNIEKFRKQIDEKSLEFDPVFKDDYTFDLHRMADEEERRIRGAGTPRLIDLQNRYVKGYTGALLRGVGMDETADYLDLKFLPVNTENDEDFISKLATGGGDAVATMGLVLGASAVAGPEAGLAVGFATNATRKYQEAYKREFDLSGNTAIAHDAGLAATPGAALESLGEFFIAGKLMPHEFRASYLKAVTSEAKADVVREALKSSEFRRKVLAVGLSSQQEGFSEVGGDMLSAFGAGQVTGRDVMPTAKDNLETYAISSIIGAGFGGLEVGMSGLDPALKARQQELKDALARGDSQAVATIAQDSIIQTAPVNENTPTVPEKPEPKLDTSTQEVADDGTIINILPGGLQVDDRTAKIHDRLVDYLTRGSTLDDLNALPPGKKKGERNNPNANNQRSVETGVQGMVEDQLDIELPERARVFAELDMATNNVNYEFSPEQIDATKRMIDSVAVTAIQNGIEPDFIYKGLSFRNSLSPEEQKAAGRRGKVQTVQESFAKEGDFESEKAKYGLMQQEFLSQSDNTQGRIQFEDENGNLQPIEVPIDQLNNKLRGIITLMNRGANITTLHHELMHYFHRSGLLNELLSPEELQGFEKAAGLQEDNIWRSENYEAVARAYEGWLRNPQIIGEGKIRVPDILQRVFRKISSAFLNVYKSLKDSPLPSKDSKSGKSTIPNIDPAFRLAFEKLYGFDPTLQLNNKLAQPNATTNTQSPVGPQLPSVNSQLTGGGQAVSPPQTQQSSTESQLTYEQDKDDKLNVKLIKSLKPKHRLDLKAQEAFKEVVELAAGLHNDPDLAGRFYALLDNFAISRKLNKSKDREQGLRSDLTDESVERANNATTKQAYVDALIKKGSDPAVTDNVIAELKTIRDAAFKLWFEQYKARFGKSMADANVEDFADKDAVIKYNAQKRQELAEQESDEEKISERRESINFNSAVAQAGLRLREDADMPGFDLPPSPLRDALFKYYEFLKRVDVSAITNDIEAFQIQHRLDALLNDDVVLGLADFARHLAQIDLGRYTSNAKFRNPYAKFGLVMLMKRMTGRDFSETFTGLDLASINIEKIAGNKAALDFLNETFMHEYYDAISKAEVVKKQFKDFLKASRLKHFGKLGADPVEMNRAGIISKIMQAPVDLDHDQVIEAIKNNVAQLRLGFENEKVHAGDDKHSGQLKIKLLDEVLEGLPEDFNQEQFIENAKRVAPKETALVLDVVGWIADNLTDSARMVSEGLFEKPFNPQSYYAPTQQVSLRPGDRNNDFELDGSFMADQYGNDAFKVKNPINVSKTGSLQERTGYLGNPEFNSFNTNFQYVIENTVDGVINDIYTGFIRRKIGYMLNTSKGGLYAQVKEILGGENLGADRVEHLRKTLSDMIFTDLAQHKYLNQLELFIGRVRQNISPALLSSLHQIITQPFSQSVAHVVRNRKILKYYPEAMKLAWQHTMNSAPAGFNVMFDRHLSERAPAPDYLLAKGQSLPRANPLDALGGYIANQMGVEEKAFSKFARGAKLVDGKIKDGLLWGLRHGDMASAKVIFAAELLAAADREQGITDSSKVEYERLSIKSLSDAVSVMDEAINASRNSRRGTILAHPGTVYSLLSIFAGHRISIAGATSLRVRNAIELSMDKNRKDGMLGDSARYVLATAMQSVAFSALKWGVLSMLIKGLYQALTPGEDDERHWLYGDLEKSEVDKLRKATQERYDTSFGPGTLKANIMRDMFGNIVMISAFAGSDNFIFSLRDKFSENNFKEGQQEAVEQLQKRIQERAEFLSAAEIQELQKQIKVIKSTKHVDLAYKNFGIGILTGGVGASAQPMIDTINAAGDAMTSETKTYSIEDFVLLMRMFGYGQPELTRALKLAAAGRDSIQENRTKEEQSF